MKNVYFVLNVHLLHIQNQNIGVKEILIIVEILLSKET